MKRLLILPLLFIGMTIHAQDFKELEDIALEEEQDYYDSEENVLECANYLIEHEPNDASGANIRASMFILRWITGAPYSFVLWSWGPKLSDKEPALLIVYMAILVKVGIENELFEGDEANLKCADIMYIYLKNENFEIKRKGYIKKFIKAGDKGGLGHFIQG